MNLLLHGIESPESDSPVHVDDALRADPGDRFDMVLTNPPLTSCSTSRRCSRSEAPLQSSSPTTCCFEGGAGETIRRRLLRECDVHTLLRLPTGIFYAQGVKANVLFFDRKPGSATPWTEDLWVYDLRTNKHFTLKARPLGRADLDDFVECYHAGNRAGRQDSDRFRRFAYDELVARDKASLDIFWLRDETLEDTDNLPSPGVIAAEIVEDLKAALVEFTQLAESLGNVGLDTDTGEPSSS